VRPVERVVDLSVPIHEGMPVDDLGPKFWVRLSHAASRPLYQYTQSREGRVFLTTDHVGTHLDGPLRFDPAGVSVERLPLDRVIRPACLLDLRGVGRGDAIGAAELERAGAGLRAGDAAVLWTGHDRHLASPDYFWHRPRLGMDGAEWLVRRRAGLVAADFPGIGPPSDDRYEVKRALHRGACLTVEQLTGLAALAGTRWHLAACPLRIRGTPGSLIRAAALVGFTARELVDLSLDIYPGMTALGGAVPTFWSRASHELTGFFYRGELSYQTTSMLLSEHAGTHLDAPYHFDPNGAAIEAMPLDGLFARARVLDLRAMRPLDGIGPGELDAAVHRLGEPIEPGDAAVVWTEHSRNYERPDYTYHRPFITAEGAAWLAARRPGLVATDLVGLDEPSDPVTPVHNCLLRAGIPQLQVLTDLGRLAGREAYVAAFPLKLVGGTGSPLRAFAALADGGTDGARR
jgi:kynurenine formamidase